MAAWGGGSIINIGSMAGHVGMPGGAAYGGTKAALAAMRAVTCGGVRWGAVPCDT